MAITKFVKNWSVWYCPICHEFTEVIAGKDFEAGDAMVMTCPVKTGQERHTFEAPNRY